jgi:AcrR family transcriptional regulator
LEFRCLNNKGYKVLSKFTEYSQSSIDQSATLTVAKPHYSPTPYPYEVESTNTAELGRSLDPRVRRTRQLITAAFKDLLKERDFQAITVQDVAERATINRATFYAHFVDKYALMDYCIREAFQQVLFSKLSLTSPLTLANLHQLILLSFEFLVQFNGNCHNQNIRQQVEPLIERQVQTELYEFILQWFGQSKLAFQQTNSTSLEVTAITLSWAIFGAGLNRSRSTEKISAEELASQILSLLTTGLAGSINLT